MVAHRIRVLIVDDFAETRESVAKLLYFEKDIEVVGAAADAVEGLRLARELSADVVLMDINMPQIDGIRATEMLVSELPNVLVIMMSVQGEPDYLRRSMLAGARDYLTKPFGADELANTIRRVYEREVERRSRLQPVAPPPSTPAEEAGPPAGKVISVFSVKGGVGCTMLATNLAIALRQLTGRRVALVDGDLQFGDVGILLNITSRKTINDLLGTLEDLAPEVLKSVMVEHSSGIDVLLAPPRPEMAELFTGDAIKAILGALRRNYEYVIVDTWTSFHEVMLSIFDVSDTILLLTTLDMPAVKNIRIFLEICDVLGYPPGKVQPVLNRADSTGGIAVADVEQAIHQRFAATIVSGGELVTSSINHGLPFILSHPDAPISRNVLQLARQVVRKEDLALAEAQRLTPTQERTGFGLSRLKVSVFRKGAD